MSAEFEERLERRARRKLRRRPRSVWFGLGMVGMVGWSVITPALLGLALGLWLDRVVPGRVGWGLSLMLGGLALGCAHAWHWVDLEWQQLRREEGDHGSQP